MQGMRVGVGDSGFRPGVEAARVRGHKINVQPYPEGRQGIQMSLTECAKAIRNGRLDPDIRGWAGDVLVQSGRPQTARGQAQSILDAFRSQVAYVADPVGAEYIASGTATLCLRPGVCVRAHDCDDAVVAVGSALMSIGIPVVVVKQNFGSGQQEHVLLEAQDEDGRWFAVDPSTKLPVGSKHPALEEQRVDPMDQNGSMGTTGPEFVTLGRVPFGLGHAPGEACCASCARGEGCESESGADFGLGKRPLFPQLFGLGRSFGLGDATDWPPQVTPPALPPGSWQPDATLTAKQGLRYVVMLAAKGAWCPGLLDLMCDWNESDATRYFEKDWVIETLASGGSLPTPSVLSPFVDHHRTLWMMRGIAKRDLQLSTVPASGVSAPVVLAMWSEVPGSASQGPPGTQGPFGNQAPAAPTTPSTIFWWALGGTTAVLATVGAVSWLTHRKRERSSSTASSRPSSSRRTTQRLLPGPLHARRLAR